MTPDQGTVTEREAIVAYFAGFSPEFPGGPLLAGKYTAKSRTIPRTRDRGRAGGRASGYAGPRIRSASPRRHSRSAANRDPIVCDFGGASARKYHPTGRRTHHYWPRAHPCPCAPRAYWAESEKIRHADRVRVSPRENSGHPPRAFGAER